MDKKKALGLILGLFVFWLLSISLFRSNLGSDVRLINDENDRSNYSLRGEWFLLGKVPYRDTPSEFPQIPTYLFAVPYLFGPRIPGVVFNYWIYSSVFSLMMLAFLAATVILLYRMLPDRKDRAFFLLLPASLYFTFNRFDILPSFLVLLSLFFLQQKKSVATGVVLGLGAMSKWYPALLLPAFLVYIFYTEHRLDWKMVLAFGLTCLLILAPTYLTGGLTALLVPFRMQAGRGLESISLGALIYQVLAVWLGLNLNASVFVILLTALQLIFSPLSLFGKIDSFEKTVNWCILIAGAFILFSRIHSPQWLLWLMPLLILAARGWPDLIWIILFDVMTYLTFPIIYDTAGAESLPLKVMGGILAFILIRMLVVAFRRTGLFSPRERVRAPGEG